MVVVEVSERGRIEREGGGRGGADQNEKTVRCPFAYIALFHR